MYSYIADSGNLQEGQCIFLDSSKTVAFKAGEGGHENDVATAVSSKSLLLIAVVLPALVV